MLLVQHHNICSLPKIRFPQNHQEDDEEESDKDLCSFLRGSLSHSKQIVETTNYFSITVSFGNNCTYLLHLQLQVQFDLTISGDKGVHVDQPSSSSSCLGFTTL
ncbi:hypothetical protein JHK82_050378 [Glycine max]|nr:hypothetical protein JHK82_050378 [Glycine max]